MSGGSEIRVLIVDDEPAIRKLLTATFASSGATVLEADCGDTALRIAAEAAPFSLVISDIVMPGIQGFELADKLAAAGHAAAFLFISGYCEDDHVSDRIRAFRAARYLPKPFAPAELMRAARELLAQNSSASRSAAWHSENGLQ